MVPNAITVETEATKVVVNLGASTQKGCRQLKKIPAIMVPQPKTTIGGFSLAAFFGRTTYNAAVIPEPKPHNKEIVGTAK